MSTGVILLIVGGCLFGGCVVMCSAVSRYGERAAAAKASSSAAASASPKPASGPRESWWTKNRGTYEQLLSDSAKARQSGGEVNAFRAKIASALKDVVEQREDNYRVKTPTDDAEMDAIIPKLRDEKHALDEAWALERPKMLAKRQFVGADPDSIVRTMLLNPNAQELWDKSYEGKFVRWQAKFLQKDMGLLSDFSANVGDSGVVECKMDDDEKTPPYEKLTKWQVVTIEGRLDDLTKKAGEQRATIKLKDCILK
jgi:hypothetical protein